MTIIPGLSLAELTRRATVGARFMRQALREVFVLLGADVRSDVPSTDDLIAAHTYWEEQVDGMLLPNVLDAFNVGADVIRKYVDVEHTVSAVTNPYVELYLQTTRNRLTGISGMVWLAARDELVEGLRNGEDVDALRSRVTRATGIVGPRAETIARTEVNGAMNAGSLIEMRQSGIPFTKKWLATAGPRTRESHAKANGQKVDGDKKFTVGGWPMDRPHDPSAPPEETENCRCTLTYEIPSERAIRRKSKKKSSKKDEGGVEDLLDLLTAGVETFHNQPGDHPGGKSPISQDDFDEIGSETDRYLTSEQSTLLHDYRNGWGGRDEVAESISGNSDYQEELQFQLERYAPNGELTVYRGGSKQTGKFANGSLDRDTAANFGSGFAGPHGEVLEDTVSTDSIRVIGHTAEMEVIYETSGVVASVAFHNQPGDHPTGHVSSSDAAWGAVPHVSDSATTLYTDGAAEIGNEWLRGADLDVTDTGYSSGEVKSMIYQLDDHFASASPLTEDVETWRGTSFVSSVTKGAIGSEFTDDGFISTSTRSSVARAYGATGTDGALIRVITPKGFRAIGVHPADQEIVLPRSTRFRITANGTTDDGIRQIDVRAVRQGGYTWDAGVST